MTGLASSPPLLVVAWAALVDRGAAAEPRSEPAVHGHERARPGQVAVGHEVVVHRPGPVRAGCSSRRCRRQLRVAGWFAGAASSSSGCGESGRRCSRSPTPTCPASRRPPPARRTRSSPWWPTSPAWPAPSSCRLRCCAAAVLTGRGRLGAAHLRDGGRRAAWCSSSPSALRRARRVRGAARAVRRLRPPSPAAPGRVGYAAPRSSRRGSAAAAPACRRQLGAAALAGAAVAARRQPAARGSGSGRRPAGPTRPASCTTWPATPASTSASSSGSSWPGRCSSPWASAL